jgi:flagellar protein FlaG
MNPINNANQYKGPENSINIPPPLEGKNLVNSTDVEKIKNVLNVEIKNSNILQETQPTREVIAKAAQQIQDFVKDMGRNLNFSVDETTGYQVVRVLDPETNEVIRQLPSKELLQIAKSMEMWQSALVNQKA